MSAIRWRKGVRPRGLCHPPACWPARRPYPWGGSHLRLACPPRLPSFACRPRPARVLPMRRSRTVYALLARCPRFAPRTRATSSLAPPAPWTCPPASCVPSHSRVRTAHTISIRRLAWGRTRVKGGSGGARAFRLLLSRAGELYTAVRRFGLEVFQLPPSHEGELEIRIPSGRHMNISTPALTRGRTTPQSHNHQTRRFQLPPYEKRSPHIRGECCRWGRASGVFRAFLFGLFLAALLFGGFDAGELQARLHLGIRRGGRRDGDLAAVRTCSRPSSLMVAISSLLLDHSMPLSTRPFWVPSSASGVAVSCNCAPTVSSCPSSAPSIFTEWTLWVSTVTSHEAIMPLYSADSTVTRTLPSARAVRVLPSMETIFASSSVSARQINSAALPEMVGSKV